MKTLKERAEEEYLENIYALELELAEERSRSDRGGRDGGRGDTDVEERDVEGRGDVRVHTTTLASVMGISPPTVTEMMQKLAHRGLVYYEPYKGVLLTEKGRRRAKDLERNHKTLAEFLMLIGVDKDVAEKDACEIEHHVEQETMRQLSRFVEFLRSCEEERGWLTLFRSGISSCDSQE